MSIELVCCEETLLTEIANQRMKRRDVAQTYRLSWQSSERSAIDWPKVHSAIIERWSMSGLIWIKKSALSGKCFKEAR